MKKTAIRTTLYAILLLLTISSCKKNNFAEGELSPITALEDVQALHKGSDVALSTDNLNGADKITGVVISDATGGNTPAGLLVVQNYRRKKLRGIALNLGAAAAKFLPGDSVLVTITGGTLTKVNGGLQISGLMESNVKKLSSNNPLTIQNATAYNIGLNPSFYESTLVSVAGATVKPKPTFRDVFSGDKTLIIGADSIIMHTETAAAFASTRLYANLNLTGILFNGLTSAGKNLVKIWPRTLKDITDTSDPNDPSFLGTSPAIITGFANDVQGSDGNYEYFQFMATTDIDFTKTPFSVITCTNAGTATPNQGAAPGAGWATGGGRTYKFNITQGNVKKGQFFYVGGNNKRINGPNSTDISAAFWARTITYTTTNGDGIGSLSSGLLPNSGNAGGIAIFSSTNITEETTPIDVIFFGGSSPTTIFNEAAGLGYRITNNDYYSTVDPATNAAQPFFRQGTNANLFSYLSPPDQGDFVKLGGVFDSDNRVWTTPRTAEHFLLTKTSDISAIETGNITKITP